MTTGHDLQLASARALAREGIDKITLAHIAEEAGIDLEALKATYPTVPDALRAIVIGAFDELDRRVEVVREATDGSDAMQRYVRAVVQYNLEHIHTFRAAYMTRQVVGNDRFGLDQATISKEIVPRVNAALDDLEQKLSMDKGPSQLAGGIHPRRLAFVTHMLATGISTVLGLAGSTEGGSKHSEEDMLREATMAIGAATSTLQQMMAVNDAARQLAQLRTERELFEIAPRLLSDALDFDDAAVWSADSEAPPLVRRVFEEGETKSEELGGVMHMATPLRYEGEVRSVLAGSCRRALGERDVARIEMLATMLGLAHENVRLYEHLHDLVEERTRKLRDAQAALVQSERMNASATLVAGLAHEFNTPMGSMLASTNTIASAMAKLSDEDTPERRARMLGVMRSAAETAQQSAERVGGILDKLVRFSRLDASERAEVDIASSLRDAAALMPDGDCRIDVEASDLSPLSCEPAQLNQVFLQLLQNAALAGAKRVRVTAAQTGGAIEIRIADDGHGIPADIMPKVFDPGFTTRGVGVGAGMGLAIAQQVVRAHHGSIELSSSPEGTTVTLCLPIEDAGKD